MEYYTYILAFHIVAVLSWMTLVFYMPRLFVYHIENSTKKDFVDVVCIQEQKIYHIIGFPAMIASIVSGLTLIWINPSLLDQVWMIAKLFILVLLIVYTFSLEYYRKRLLNNSCDYHGQFFRAFNEIPTLLSILVVTFVITKSIPIYFSIGISLFFAFLIFIINNKKTKQ